MEISAPTETKKLSAEEEISSSTANIEAHHLQLQASQKVLHEYRAPESRCREATSLQENRTRINTVKFRALADEHTQHVVATGNFGPD